MLLIFLYLFLLGTIIALVFTLNTMINLFRDKVPYVSTPQWAIDWLCENLPLLPARPAEGEAPPNGGPREEGMSRASPMNSGTRDRGRGSTVVIDLGCGDARVLVALKKHFPNIKAIGYERNWWPWLLAKIQTRGTGIEIRRSDFYQANLRDADIVFCFLIHSVMPKVERLLRSQLKPGATVYSYGFTFPTWQPVERVTNPDNPTGSKINIYRVS